MSAGLYAAQGKREIVWDASGAIQVMETDSVLGYLGYNIFDWFTIYATGGSSENKIQPSATSNSEDIYGAGIRINLLNHFIREPVPAEDVVRLNFTTEYLCSSVEYYSNTIDWDELSVALTVALVNHTDGNKLFTPESIMLYAGPLYSSLTGDSFEANDTIGVIGGIEIYLTDTITVDFQVKQFEETTVGGGVNFRF